MKTGYVALMMVELSLTGLGLFGITDSLLNSARLGGGQEGDSTRHLPRVRK
jgi:hypothetical protein